MVVAFAAGMAIRFSSFVTFAVLSSTLGAFGNGCIIGIFSTDYDRSEGRGATLDPSSMEAHLVPATCKPNADVALNDLLDLEVIGATNVAPVPARLSLDISRSVAGGEPITLFLEPQSDTATTTATSADGKVHLSLEPGSAAKLGDSPAKSIVVTLLSLPTHVGEDVEARVQIDFQDGTGLDDRYFATLGPAEPCAVGSSPEVIRPVPADGFRK